VCWFSDISRLTPLNSNRDPNEWEEDPAKKEEHSEKLLLIGLEDPLLLWLVFLFELSNWL
jgi:hypothetical protein